MCQDERIGPHHPKENSLISYSSGSASGQHLHLRPKRMGNVSGPHLTMVSQDLPLTYTIPKRITENT